MFSMTYYTKTLTYPAVLRNEHNVSVLLRNMSVRYWKNDTANFTYTVSKAE